METTAGSPVNHLLARRVALVVGYAVALVGAWMMLTRCSPGWP